MAVLGPHHSVYELRLLGKQAGCSAPEANYSFSCSLEFPGFQGWGCWVWSPNFPCAGQLLVPDPGCRHSHFHPTAQGAAGEPPPRLGPPALRAGQGCWASSSSSCPVLSMWCRQSQAQLDWVEFCLPGERKQASRQAFTPSLIKGYLSCPWVLKSSQRHYGSLVP